MYAFQRVTLNVENVSNRRLSAGDTVMYASGQMGDLERLSGGAKTQGQNKNAFLFCFRASTLRSLSRHQTRQRDSDLRFTPRSRRDFAWS
jgi:hypothetical protein